MKLWEKDKKTSEEVLKFTIGNDPLFDKLLAPYDIIASMAHARMLGKVGLISQAEADDLVRELLDYYPETCKDSFQLHPGDEDIHSHIENYLVEKVGDTGKKIHTARSRNDQVLVAMQLFLKEEIRQLVEEVIGLFEVLMDRAEQHKDMLIPGYTHTQVAMPSSIALWLGAYGEALVSDLKLMQGILSFIDQNPLGSAAGFGSSFPVDREMTTRLAGFRDVLVSPVSAQLNRGKLESVCGFGLSAIATSLSKLASDMILYMSQDMNFISFPEELTTGSSIMPHKKNPDVLELIRAHCNRIMQIPAALNGIGANLISGYHRDFQLTKEILFPGISQLKQCLSMMKLMVSAMEVRSAILEDEKYKYIFSVERVNEKVMNGSSFRDAYREVAEEISSGSYRGQGGADYTHLGSIGNPGLDQIRRKMKIAQAAIQIKAAAEILKDLSGQ